MTIDPAIDITVVICTRNRAESLRETLGCLIRADRTNLRCEVIVVDNASTDHTAEVAAEAGREFPVRHVVEPIPGKSHCLARATSAFPLGQIVAVLDDDMSPHEDWFQQVNLLCQRRPDHDLFSGRSYIVWPCEEVPAWCRDPSLRGWAFSVLDCARETELADGRWFSGNYFWFRSRVLAKGHRITPCDVDPRTHLEACEPRFMLELVEAGYRGVISPGAQCGHRIQEELLDLRVLTLRAMRVGRGFAFALLDPPKSKVKQSRLMQSYPLLGRLYCLLSLIGWGSLYVASWLVPSGLTRIPRRLKSIERWSRYREYLRIASRMRDYATGTHPQERSIFRPIAKNPVVSSRLKALPDARLIPVPRVPANDDACEQSILAQTTLQPMSHADYAALQTRLGVEIVAENGRYWRPVRPMFYRPLLPVEPYDPTSVERPVSWPSAYQHVVPDRSTGNSFMSFLILDRPQEYSLEGLTHKRRQLIKRAAQQFQIRRLFDGNNLKAHGHPVYLSFFERTRYPYRSDRKSKPVFDRWVDAITASPQAIILGGYGPSGLAAISSSYWVNRTLVYSTLICDTESMRKNIGELIFHEVQMLAARQSGIDQILVRGYQGGNTLDQYYLHRGCRLARMPARMVMSRPIQSMVRWFMPRNYELLFGDE